MMKLYKIGIVVFSVLLLTGCASKSVNTDDNCNFPGKISDVSLNIDGSAYKWKGLLTDLPDGCVYVHDIEGNYNLDHRIDLRTKQMYDDGFIEEVERLRPHLGATAVRALGYQQIIDLLDGIWDVNDAFADIAQKTKRLARKQMGWFGRDPRIHWLQALNPKLVDNAMAIIAHADAGDYDPIDARADEYTQHHLGDITA